MAAAEIFVYYRVAAANEQAAGREVAQFQRALCGRFPGLQARLLQRRDDGGAAPTLMETYAGSAAPTPELLAAIDQAARVLEPWLLGERHLEVFEPCA